MSSNNQPNNIYVGNRYVPIFADPVEWNNLREYEPLTIVTYQGTSYTSRQTVPVGTPLTDTNYWVVTGNYNAQVAEYRQAVENLTSDVDNLENDVNLLTTEKSRRINKKILIVGDSYGLAEQHWPSLMGQLYGFTDYTNLCVSGSGFIVTDVTTYLGQLQNYTGNKTSITDILICGGYNDVRTAFSPSINKIQLAIQELMNYVKANYPNAVVKLGFIGNDANETAEGAQIRQDIANIGLPAYKSINLYGGTYLNGVENIMHDYIGNFAGDGVHPNSTGVYLLARYIGEAFIEGSTEVLYNLSSDYTLTNGFSTNITAVYTFLKDDTVRICFNASNITFAAMNIQPGDEGFKLFDSLSRYLKPSTSQSVNGIDVMCKLYNSSGLVAVCPAQIVMQASGGANLIVGNATTLENIVRIKFLFSQSTLSTLFH